MTRPPSRRPPPTPPPLVLRLLRAVHEATKENPPFWVTVDSLQLRIDQLRLEQAIQLAVNSGWIEVTGSSPVRVAITATGIDLAEHTK